MDTTGSMNSWIRAATKEIEGIIDKVKEEYSDIIVRVAFIGYKDICDGKANLSSNSILDFTS